MFFSRYKASLLLGIITLGLQSCSQVDNYILGKDNTLPPSPLVEFTPKFSLKEKWSVSAGNPGKASDELKLTPVIKKGIIYTASQEGVVQATKKSNGKVLWSNQLSQRLMSGPTVSNGYIALATTNSTLLVLSQQDGKTLWQANLSGDSLAKPVIAGDYVLVKTINGNLYSFKLKNGEKRWAVDHGSPHLILKASSAPVIMGNTVLVGFSDGKLDAVHLETGQVLWQRNLAYANGGSDVERLIDIDADPIPVGSEVYLASYQGYVGSLSLTNGEFIWKKPASVYKNIVIVGNTLLYVDSDSVVWALNRINGQVKWKQDALKARGLTEPVVMGNRIFIGDKQGYLHGIDITSGQFVSRTFANAPIYSSPIVSGSSIYILTTNGRLTRYQFAN